MTHSRPENGDVPLIERLRESDREAFRLLFQKYQPILFRNVLHSVRDADATHDIVQETFIRVWNHRASLKPRLPFLAFLFRVSRNLVLDQVKRIAVRIKLESEVVQTGDLGVDNPVDSLELKMLEERLVLVVNTKLPKKCREVFLLSRMEEMSNAEISEHLGISPKTVENQITRALKILRRHLRLS